MTERAATALNAENLSPGFLAHLTDVYGGTRLAAQELEGLVVEGEGALFSIEELRRARGARPPELDRVVGVFLRLERALPFESVDRQPVDLVFALFAPEDNGVRHLKALALVARAMRDPKVQAKLRANDDPAILYTILVGPEESQAA